MTATTLPEQKTISQIVESPRRVAMKTPANRRIYEPVFASMPAGSSEKCCVPKHPHTFVTIDDAGRSIVYLLESDDTSSENFRYITFRQVGGQLRIDGKQLYANRRYVLGRLMVGRFKDFLSRNDDETIGGELAGDGFSAEIRFEKIEEGDLKIHWSNLVPWGDPTHTKQQSADEFAFFFADAVSG